MKNVQKHCKKAERVEKQRKIAKMIKILGKSVGFCLTFISICDILIIVNYTKGKDDCRCL